MFAKWLFSFRIVIFLCSVFSVSFLQAQDSVIEGRITSVHDDAPIEGVFVKLADSSKEAVSDATGYFSIEASANTKLTFYYPVTGLDSSIVSVNGFNYIRLKVDTYPSSKLSGAAGASVYRANLNQGVIAGPEQLIQGRVTGLQTTSASGDPGAFTYSIIRGVNSLYSNQPLIVLDGIPVSMNQFSPASFDLGYGVKQDRDPLRYINPNDIQKIEVIKDGSSAMYGVRGGNGVILITTRDAGYKRHRFEYSSQLTIASVSKRLDLLGREAFLKKLYALGGSDQSDYHNNTDWQSEVLQRTLSHKHDFSYSDRYKNGQLRASLGYEDQEGIVHQSSMKRLSARLNMQHSFLNDRLTLNAKLLFSRINDQMAPITTNRTNLIESMISTNPTVSSSTSQFGGIITPTGWMQYTRDQSNSNVYWTSLAAAYKFTENFKLNVNANIDGSVSKRNNVYGDPQNPASNGSLPVAMIQQLNVTNNFLEGNLTYDKKLSKGVFTSVLGFSDQRFRNKKTDLAGAGFQSDDLNAITSDLRTAGSLLTSVLSSTYYNFGYDNSTFFASFLQPMNVATYNRPNDVPVGKVVGSQSQTGYVLRSYFLRLGYEHQHKYIFNAGIRRDASNHFGDKYPAGYFPYVTAAWIISNEDFFDNKNIYLKLRGSIGSAGNAYLLTNRTIMRTTFSDVRLSSGPLQQPFVINSQSNPDLRWETVTQSAIGFDFSLSNERLSCTLDFYKKVTHNMLGFFPAAQPAVNSLALQNMPMEVANKGIELSLTYELLQRKNTSIALGAVFSHNTNEVSSYNGSLDLAYAYGQGTQYNTLERLRNNQPLYEYYMRKFQGFDQNGYPIGDVQQFQNKNAIPKVNTGFTMDIKYKRFYLSSLLTGQFGHYLYNNTANNLLTMGALSNTHNVTVEAASTKESGNAEALVSSRFLEKANFLRLQQLIAGYRFIFAKGRIDQLQISAIAQNLFVITKYSGFDPEVNTSAGSNTNASYGIDYTSYPRARMFTLNVGVTF